MYGFAYHVDKEHGYHMLDGETKQEYTSAYKGVVYWDPSTNAIMRIIMETIDIPSSFPIRDVIITLDYDLTKVGDQALFCRCIIELDSKADKFSGVSEADFKLYRKYGAESTLTFGDTTPTAPDQLKEDPQKKRGEPQSSSSYAPAACRRAFRCAAGRPHVVAGGFCPGGSPSLACRETACFGRAFPLRLRPIPMGRAGGGRKES